MLLCANKALARYPIPLMQESLLEKEHVVEHNLEGKSFLKFYPSSDEAEVGIKSPGLDLQRTSHVVAAAMKRLKRLNTNLKCDRLWALSPALPRFVWSTPATRD